MEWYQAVVSDKLLLLGTLKTFKHVRTAGANFWVMTPSSWVGEWPCKDGLYCSLLDLQG